MASLALGIGGAFLGSAFGPLGASIGWTLGSALGNALFPEKVEGPRLQDLRLHTSSYGKMIPKLWGTMRVAGNVIWIGNGGELVEHEETSGGKGGPEVTNFTYSASFAIALIDHEIVGIRRILANGRLISDDGGSGLPVTIYRGTETQLPDPTMEADLGVGNVPGYRGVAYVVFEDYFLTEFGNAIPNIEFEVYTSAGTIPIRVSSFDAVVTGGSGTVGGVTSDGTVITQAWYGTDGSLKVRHWLYDGTATGTDFDGSLSGVGTMYGRALNLDAAVYSPHGVGDEAYFWVAGAQGHQLLGAWPTPAVQTGVAQNNVLYFPWADGGAAGIVGYPLVEGQPQSVPSGTITLAGASGGSLHIGYNASGENVFVFDSSDGAMWELTPDLTEIVNSWESSDFPSDGGFYGVGFTRYRDFFAWNYSTFGTPRANLIGVAGSGDPPALSNYSMDRGVGDFPSFVWEGGDWAPLGGGYYLGRDGVVLLEAPLEGIPLSVIVGDIATDCGLTAEEQDVTELTDIVDGYLVDRQTSGRDMIQPLRDAYFFDGVEIDDKVVFPKRKADSLVTIPADDLAAHADGEDAPPVVATARVQEVDLPAIVTVNYVNAAADYQAGSQTSQRQVTQSQSAVSLTFQINMSDQKAKSVADTHVMLPWVERNRFTAYVSRKYAKYTPTDVVTVDNKKLRIIDVSETRNGVLKFDGVAAFAPVLIQAGLPVTNLTFTSTPGTVTPPAAAVETVMYLFDLPLVDDADEPNGIYAAVSGGTGWAGVGIFKSSDGGATYTSIATTSTPSTMGTTTDVLGDWAGGNMFDESNIVTVVLRSGQTLSSATELAVLNGANECVIGDEVIQFKNAELVDTDTYELSGLLRGRLGTEWATGDHAIGDRFALLPILRVPAPSDELTQERLYKPVTFGATVAGSTAQAFTNTGRALKPYSPVLLGGGVNGSGDVTLNWTRRTRIGGAWLPNVDVPLSEPSEQYVVQIFNSDYSLCGRAEFVSTTTYTYTAADQVSDFGAAQETIFFSVAQLGEWSVGKQARGTAPGSGSTNDDPIVSFTPIE